MTEEKKFFGIIDTFYSADIRNKLNNEDRVTLKHDNGFALKEKWERQFLKGIASDKLNDIHLDQFLWHAVSYGRIDAKEGEVARALFNEAIKDGCIFFFQECSLVYEVVKSSKVSDSFFDKLNDIYVVNEDFTWCYIHTHEEYCGPYYFEINHTLDS